MTFTIPQLIQLFITACAALGTISGAVVVIKKVIDYFKKPDKDRDADIKRHAEMLDNDNKRIKYLEERDRQRDKLDRLVVKSMHALLSHELDGNHTDALKETKKDIEDYIYER